MYNEMYSPQISTIETSATPPGYPTPMKDPNSDDSKIMLQNSDKIDLMRNLRFIKEEQAYLFDAYRNDSSQK